MKTILKYKVELGIIIIPILIFFGLNIIGFNGLYGQDSYEYVRYGQAWLNFMKGGVPPGEFAWPVFYPLFGATWALITGLPVVVTMQLISIYAWVGTGILLFKLLSETTKSNSRILFWYVFVAFCLSPFVVRVAIAVMSDMMAAFFIMGGYWSFEKYRSTEKGKYFVLFAASLAIASMTRYPSVVILIIPSIIAFIKIIRQRNYTVFIVGVVVGILALIPLIVSNQGASFYSLQPYDIRDIWSVNNFFKNEFIAKGAILTYSYPNIVKIFMPFFYPGYLIWGVLVLFNLKLVFKKDLLTKMMWISVFLYLFFIGGFDSQNDRLFLIVFPLIVYLFFPIFNKYEQKIKVKQFAVAGVLLLGILNITMGLYASRKMIAYNQLERNICEYLNTLPQNTIYSFGKSPSINYYTSHKTITLFQQLDLVPESGTLILFSEKELNSKLNGRPAMAIWEQLKFEKRLTLKQSFSNGWAVYDIR